MIEEQHRAGRMMFVIAEYQLEDVFAAMQMEGKATLPDGRTFKKSNHRLTLFHTKGTKCVNCDRQGTLFVLETHDRNISPHLNLYAVSDTGKRILMTKDHIQPKSKGGKNLLENYNTMCSPCNFKKADKTSS